MEIWIVVRILIEVTFLIFIGYVVYQHYIIRKQGVHMKLNSEKLGYVTYNNTNTYFVQVTE